MRWMLALFALPLIASVDGIVTNQTTGKPQQGATVTLYKLGGAGMESVESVKSDASGKFVINQNPQGPHLIQTAFDGVTYNHLLPPGAPMTGIQLEVFNSGKKAADAKVRQHMILLEPVEGRLVVNENVIFVNEGKLTYNDPEGGTLKFHMPAAANGKSKVMAAAPNGMPIERAAMATKTSNIFAIDFPIKPGETRFQISYDLPMPNPPVFAGPVMHGDSVTRLIVPKGVSLTGDGLEDEGREPRTQAAIYRVKSKEFKVTIEGTGSLRESEGAGAAEGGGGSGEEGPGIQEIKPRIYDGLRLGGIPAYVLFIGITLAILALGFFSLFGRRK